MFLEGWLTLYKEVGLTRLEQPPSIGDQIGGDLYAALLILGFQANEIQVFQMRLAANIKKHTDSPPFWQRPKIVSNTIVRTLGDRLYAGLKGVSGMPHLVGKSELNLEQKSAFSEAFIAQILNIEILQKDTNYSILREVRDKVNQHARPQGVAHVVPRTFAGASHSLFFGDQIANAFFPASEDFVFGSKLHNLLGDKVGELIDTVAFEYWLRWLIDTTSDHLLPAQNILIWFVAYCEGFNLMNETHILEPSYVCRRTDARLPLYFELGDAVADE